MAKEKILNPRESAQRLSVGVYASPVSFRPPGFPRTSKVQMPSEVLIMDEPSAKERRAKKWDSTFIPCKRHPERRCNRSAFVSSGHYRCARCKSHRVSGEMRPSYRAHVAHTCARKDWARSMRAKLHSMKQGWWTDPLKLFERYCGVTLGYTYDSKMEAYKWNPSA